MPRYELLQDRPELIVTGADDIDAIAVKVLNDLVQYTDRQLNIFIGSVQWRFAGTALWRGTHQNFYETLYYSEEGEYMYGEEAKS